MTTHAPLDNRIVKRDPNQLFTNLFGDDEQDVSGTTVLGGTTSASLRYRIHKAGKLVVVQFIAGNATKNGSTGVINSSTPIPTDFIPSNAFGSDEAPFVICDGIVNGTRINMGFYIIQSGVPQQGIINMYNATPGSIGDFPASATISWKTCSLVYNLA